MKWASGVSASWCPDQIKLTSLTYFYNFCVTLFWRDKKCSSDHKGKQDNVAVTDWGD